MGSTAILAVRIISDASQAGRGFSEAEGQVSRFREGLGQAAAVGTAVTAGMIAIGAASVKAASDAQQAAGAVETVFGAASAEVLKYGENAAQSAGLAESAYGTMAATLGAQLKNLGVSQADVAGQTNELIHLGADLAATFGGTTSDAVQALSALFRGEMDPIERYGVSIKQTDVNARVAAMGLSHLDGEAKKQAETQARLSLLYEQTASAQGMFARESDTAAGQQARLNAEFENAKASLGQALLPILTQLAGVLANVARWINDNATAFWVIVGVVGTLSVILITLNAALTAYEVISGVIAAVNAVQAASWFATAAAEMAALWPLALIVVAILAVIAVVWLIIANLDTLREWWDIAFEAGRTAVQWVWDKLQQLGSWIAGQFNSIVDKVGSVFSTAFGIAKSVVEALLSPINAIISAIQSLIGWISNIHWPSPPGWLSALNPFSLSAPSPAVASMYRAPGVDPFSSFRGPAPRVTPGRTGNVYVTINGAIDPVAVGKQVRRVVRVSDRGLGMAAAVVLSNDRSTY